jgi:hypothetical protein
MMLNWPSAQYVMFLEHIHLECKPTYKMKPITNRQLHVPNEKFIKSRKKPSYDNTLKRATIILNSGLTSISGDF